MKQINIYMCGPTLFDYVHIGCYRIFVLADIIDKHFSSLGYMVNHGINIMDLDDKIISCYQENNTFNVNEFYKSLKQEFQTLNIKYPNCETRTTECIDDLKKTINFYLNQGIAYVTNSGVYLNLNKIDNYGELTHLNIKKNINNTSTGDKQNISDPSLWRFTDSSFSYEYLGKQGRPGWDIQCANCCVTKLDSKVNYQFAGFNDVTHYENEKVLIENSYNWNGYSSKWVLAKYLNFVDDTPYFYMKDYINEYSRQVIKYAIYSISYASAFDLTKDHFLNSIKDIEKINVFYDKLEKINSHCDTDNDELDKILSNFENIDCLIENLKMPIILGNLFKLIRCVNRNQFQISKNQTKKIINIIQYLNYRLDFLY